VENSERSGRASQFSRTRSGEVKIAFWVGDGGGCRNKRGQYRNSYKQRDLGIFMSQEIASGFGYRAYDEQFEKGKIPAGSEMWIRQGRHGFHYFVREDGKLEWSSDPSVIKTSREMLEERNPWEACAPKSLAERVKSGTN
jgi:hypothetical protein